MRAALLVLCLVAALAQGQDEHPPQREYQSFDGWYHNLAEPGLLC